LFITTKANEEGQNRGKPRDILSKDNTKIRQLALAYGFKIGICPVSLKSRVLQLFFPI
jgi:hypothetical protein